MLPLPNKRIGKQALSHLQTIQKEIDREIVFADKVRMAQEKWRKKKTNNAAKGAFATIETVLDSMHPRKGICQYGEMNETSPIEHIFPKRYFPERAFIWENYLRACYNCNSHLKGDKFAVFYPQGSANIHKLESRRDYNEPPNNDNVFINPRAENPQVYMMLDLMLGMFIPVPGTDARGCEKAKYTCETLGLNLCIIPAKVNTQFRSK